MILVETSYTGWALPASERTRLLAAIPPAYPIVVAHHITRQYDVPADTAPPPATFGEIVGMADDNSGVQALVVRLGGTTRRDDGNTYHITWSLAEGRKAVESNAVIRDHGWQPLPHYIAIKLEPKLFTTESQERKRPC